MALQVNVDNLLDKRYHSRVGGINSYNMFGKPRSVQMALRVSL